MEEKIVGAILLVVFCLCIVWLLNYLIKAKCGKKNQSVSISTEDLESGFAGVLRCASISSKSATTSGSSSSSHGSKDTLTTSSDSMAIPIRPRLYSEVPVLVKPLTPPRAVVLVEDLLKNQILNDEERYDLFMMSIRNIQQTLKTATTATLKCNLVIGVHASDQRIAGYCVNLIENECQIYTYDPGCLPWKVEEDDFVEIGAKNLLFALLMWEKEIIRAKKVRLYAGSGSIISNMQYEDVHRVIGLMGHYHNCHKVTWVNEKDMSIYSNSDSDESSSEEDEFLQDVEDPYSLKEEDFQKLAKFIQPVVDLCHFKIKVCERHLSNFYGIEPSKFFTTHRQTKWNKVERRPWIETTCAYELFLEKVKVSVGKWEKPCKKCGLGLVG